MQPSVAVRLIRALPVGRTFAFRVYHRLMLHLAPRRVVRTYYGAEFNCHVQDLIQGNLIHFRTWEPNSSRVFSTLVKPGDTVVDLGANIGYFTLLFSKLTGKKGAVVAVEALPKIAAILNGNLARNGTKNVRVVNMAVAAEEGTVTMYEGPDLNIGSTTSRADRGYPAVATVASAPLTMIITAEEAAKTTLIKIDVEGAEVPVMNDILESLDRFHPRLSIAVEVNADGEWPALFDRFKALGFEAYDLGNRYASAALLYDWRVEPRRMEELEVEGQTDVLFTRAGLPA